MRWLLNELKSILTIPRIMLASMKHYNSMSRKNSDPGAWEIVGFVVGILCAFIGTIIHASNLDSEPATRSFSMSFLGANLGVAYIYFAIEPGKWQDCSPLVVAIAIIGLLVGVTSFDGDPQAEMKKNAAWEEEVVKMFARQDKDVKARWEKEKKEELEKEKARREAAKDK